MSLWCCRLTCRACRPAPPPSHALATAVLHFLPTDFDVGGGDIWMSTLSVPVAGPDGTLAAVVTADVRAGQGAGAATVAPAAVSGGGAQSSAQPGAVAAAAGLLGLLLLA